MKILIGTPIHEDTDYCMNEWLKNVADLLKVTPVHLLLVDSSPGLEYIEKVKGYCKKYEIKNCQVEHIEFHQANGPDERIGRSREVIREYILTNGYHAWFNWECDQIIPVDTLDKLARIMVGGKYMMIQLNSFPRDDPSVYSPDLGSCLIKTECLEKYGFLLDYPNMPDCWYGSEAWFKKKVINEGLSYIEIYGVTKSNVLLKHRLMKILIGTPIHVSKDYSMERWIQNVVKLRLKSPADFLMVDNSPDHEYVKRVKGYCKKYGIKNYKIIHIDFDQGMSMDEKDKRIEMSQEIIRKEVLSKSYDAWFSWECDQLIPTNALDKLVKLMEAGNFMMVDHNSWGRGSVGFLPDMGCVLIGKECLKRHGFIMEPDFDRSQGGETWYKERVFRSGGNYTDVYGVINPIYHLNDNE